jgi:hypothetical protein
MYCEMMSRMHEIGYVGKVKKKWTMQRVGRGGRGIVVSWAGYGAVRRCNIYIRHGEMRNEDFTHRRIRSKCVPGSEQLQR